MKIRVLPSSPREPGRLHYLTTFLLNGEVAIDAGCLGTFATPSEQGRVRDVFLTHSHADHTAALPLYLENVIEEGRDGPTVHASAFTLASLRQDVFNHRVWPNFVELEIGDRRLVHLQQLEPERPVTVRGLTFTPVEVNHPVPTFAYVVEDAKSAVIFSGDTGPTTRLWELARTKKNLRAVFLECSFADERSDLARRSGHLTPTTFLRELIKLDRKDVLVFAFHLKPRWRDTIVSQLAALKLKNVAVAELDREYEI
jgi:ribonuclease BN (tRNA processing enzyme)